MHILKHTVAMPSISGWYRLIFTWQGLLMLLDPHIPSPHPTPKNEPIIDYTHIFFIIWSKSAHLKWFESWGCRRSESRISSVHSPGLLGRTWQAKQATTCQATWVPEAKLFQVYSKILDELLLSYWPLPKKIATLCTDMSS